jgi:hypothetical protein
MSFLLPNAARLSGIFSNFAKYAHASPVPGIAFRRAQTADKPSSIPSKCSINYAAGRPTN